MSDTSTTVPERLRDEAESIGDTVQETAVEVKQQGTQKLQEQLDARTSQAGQQATKVAGALRRSGSDLEQGGDADVATRLMHEAAGRIERLGTYLEEARGAEILRDAERLARQRPWLVAGAAALTGFAASRFLKASSERRYEESEYSRRYDSDWARAQAAV